jgi:general secretion pathway protein G
VYTQPGRHNTYGYDLLSFGPDGKEGGGDDIDNWSPRES